MKFCAICRRPSRPTAGEASSTSASAQDRSASVLKGLVESLIADRQKPRETRDFDAADRIRKQLTEAGVSLEDTPRGTSWKIEG